MSAPAGLSALRAGLARRLAAVLYEALLAVAIVLVAGFALLPLVSPGVARGDALVAPTFGGRALSFAAIAGLFAAYYGYSLSGGRRTLPMKAWRLAIVTQTGAPLTARRALGRYAAWWIGPALGVVAHALLHPVGAGALSAPLFLLNYLAALVDPDRRFLHDRIAGTRIVTA